MMQVDRKNLNTEILHKWSYRILVQVVQKDPNQRSCTSDPTGSWYKWSERILKQRFCTSDPTGSWYKWSKRILIRDLAQVVLQDPDTSGPKGSWYRDPAPNVAKLPSLLVGAHSHTLFGVSCRVWLFDDLIVWRFDCFIVSFFNFLVDWLVGWFVVCLFVVAVVVGGGWCLLFVVCCLLVVSCWLLFVGCVAVLQLLFLLLRCLIRGQDRTGISSILDHHKHANYLDHSKMCSYWLTLSCFWFVAAGLLAGLFHLLRLLSWSCFWFQAAPQTC